MDANTYLEGQVRKLKLERLELEKREEWQRIRGDAILYGLKAEALVNWQLPTFHLESLCTFTWVLQAQQRLNIKRAVVRDADSGNHQVVHLDLPLLPHMSLKGDRLKHLEQRVHVDGRRATGRAATSLLSVDTLEHCRHCLFIKLRHLVRHAGTLATAVALLKDGDHHREQQRVALMTGERKAR